MKQEYLLIGTVLKPQGIRHMAKDAPADIQPLRFQAVLLRHFIVDFQHALRPGRPELRASFCKMRLQADQVKITGGCYERHSPVKVFAGRIKTKA